MEGVDFIAAAAMLTLGWSIWRNHFYRPKSATKKNPMRTRLTARYDSPTAANCRVKELTVIAPDVAKLDCESPSGERFVETRNRYELDCDIFQILCGNDPPRVFVKARKAEPSPIIKDTVVEEKWICEQCGKEFEKKSNLASHKRFCKVGEEDVEEAP